MAEIGKINNLRIVKQVDFGLYLDGGDDGEILLPRRYQPDEWMLDEYIDVFVYLDSEDIPIATTETPRIQVGECAFLRVVESNRIGAFLDWGLTRDLFVPHSEQRVPMEVNRMYVVYCYVDKSGRIAATSRFQRYLPERVEPDSFEENQAVDLLITGKSDLGFKAVVNGEAMGLIHHNEILSPIRAGQRMVGYIREIRGDGKLNLSLQPGGQEMRNDLERQILNHLKDNDGVMTLTDKSAPEAIFNTFGVSKGNFKKALGKLYKDKLVSLHPKKVTLN